MDSKQLEQEAGELEKLIAAAQAQAESPEEGYQRVLSILQEGHKAEVIRMLLQRRNNVNIC